MSHRCAWTFYWGEVGALAHYEIARLDPTYVPGATAFLTDDLAHYQTLAGANSFRAAVDQFDWGSAETMMGAALTALWYEDLTGDTRYHALAQAQRDYVLGGNPWGVSFVNSVGTTWPHHPHHQVADLTHSELVGFWDEGPVTRAAFEAQGITLRQADIYAAFQSDAAVYHDDVEDYITNEPTITMNAVGLALTAWYAPSVPAITPTPTSTPTSTPTVTATPTATSPPPGACLSDANANGRVDVVDIMTTAQTPACWVYLPLIVNAWRQPWPTPTPTATPTATPTPTPTSTTSLCPDPQPPFVTDFQVRQPPSLPEPPARVPFRDPVFGTCLARVTNRTTDLAPGDTSAGLKNEYSRVQSFNADESRILVRGIEATWYLYDARTLQPLGQLAFGGSVDPRWDASNPDVLYFSDETRLMAYNIATQETTVVHEFANDFPGQTLAAVWSKYEGSPSRDSRYWGFMAEDQNWNTVAFLVYDQQADWVIAKRDMRGVLGVEEVDNAYISPLGTYFIADFADYYCQPGQLGTDARPCGYMVYDRSLQNGRGLLRISSHQDLALDATGREVVVYQDIDTDFISMLDLATGTITPLWPIDFSYTAIGFHFSGRAFNRPGWAVVSTHDSDVASHTWMDDQVFLIELKPNGRVVRLAHTHSLVDASQEHDYWAEPHASANRDLTRVLFTTNWGRSGTEEVEMYLIELPTDWIVNLP